MKFYEADYTAAPQELGSVDAVARCRSVSRTVKAAEETVRKFRLEFLNTQAILVIGAGPEEGGTEQETSVRQGLSDRKRF